MERLYKIVSSLSLSKVNRKLKEMNDNTEELDIKIARLKDELDSR